MMIPELTDETLAALKQAMQPLTTPKRIVKPADAIRAERRSLIKKLLSREYEGLRMYESGSYLAEQFHACNAVWRLADGCLAGEQEIYDPVIGRSRRIDSIRGSFHVLSKNPLTGEDEIRKSPAPFIKAIGELYRFTLSNGTSLSATLDHRVLNSRGEWVSMRKAWNQRLALLCLPSLADAVECCIYASSLQQPHLVIPQNTIAPIPSGQDDFWDEASHPRLFKWNNSNTKCSIIAVDKIADNGAIWDLCVPPHANYLAAGLYNANSNRAMKSFTCSAEDARAMLGCDPYDKYPKTNGYALFVGLERKNLSLMYRTLFIEGAFKVIRDEHTGLYRTVRWNRHNPSQLQEYDEAYREKWRDGPPLIPPRMVEHIAFDIAEVPRTIRLKNGWRSLWQSAAGKPELGSHYNHVHFDEEMPSTEFYSEAHRGLTRLHETLKHQPKGIWSATSQVSNVDLAELRDKALADPESDFVRQFIFLVEDNPYILPEARKVLFEGLSDEARQTRYFGIPASQVRRIYTAYSPMGDSDKGTGHGCEPFEIDPKVYARYVILDPAINHCMTLFVAVDPDEQFLTVYDGFDWSGKTPREWAAEVKKRQCGVKFEARVIDQQMGSVRTQGNDMTTVAYKYSDALRELDVQFRQNGPMEGFFRGSNDVDARTLSLKSLMEIRGGGAFAGTCKLRVMRGMFPALDKQIRRAQTDPDNPTKRLKNPKVPQDWLDCYDAKTEVLTQRRGWLRFADLAASDCLATVNLQTDAIEYQLPTRHISKHYCGNLFYFGGAKMDVAVTPNHRMVAYRSYPWKGKNNPSELLVVSAKDLIKDRDRLKLHATWLGGDTDPFCLSAAANSQKCACTIDRGVMAELMGWFLSEGSFDCTPKCPGNGYRVTISQTKPKTKAILKTFLSTTPWTWTEIKDGFSCSSKQLWSYVRQFGKCYDKFVPQWIKDSDPDTIRRFLRSAILGDGYKHERKPGRQYYTVSKQLADDIQELFIKTGTTAAVRKKHQPDYNIDGRTGKSCGHIYWVMEWTHPRAFLSNHARVPNYQAKHYDGMVYCATVPNGTLIVRRNGCPVIAGNCLEYSAAGNLAYFTPEVEEVPEKKVPTAYEILEARKAKRRELARYRQRGVFA